MAARMQTVDSRSLAAFGYDERTRELWVRFKASPRLYVYSGVPPHVFRELEEADSKGAFVNKAVKPRYAVRSGL